jgi:hypothetical protein
MIVFLLGLRTNPYQKIWRHLPIGTFGSRETKSYLMRTHISLNLEIFYYTDFINIDFFVNRHIKLR